MYYLIVLKKGLYSNFETVLVHLLGVMSFLPPDAICNHSLAEARKSGKAWMMQNTAQALEKVHKRKDFLLE